MITTETPYKLADIIRDTWPQLYRPSKKCYNKTSSIEKLMKFTVYSKLGCPYCTKIKQVLELANLEHVVYTLDEDFTRNQFYAEFGEGSTFPQVILNNQDHLGGCSETVQYLKEQKLV